MSKKDIIKKFKGNCFTGKWLKRYLEKRTTKTKLPTHWDEDDAHNETLNSMLDEFTDEELDDMFNEDN